MEAQKKEGGWGGDPRLINKHRNKQKNSQHEERIWRNHARQRSNEENMHKFLQITQKPTVLTPESTMESSPDTKEIPQFTEEVERDEKTQSPWKLSNYKRHYKLGGGRGGGGVKCPHLPNKHLP